jgi:hypothetical protein
MVVGAARAPPEFRPPSRPSPHAPRTTQCKHPGHQGARGAGLRAPRARFITAVPFRGRVRPAYRLASPLREVMMFACRAFPPAGVLQNAKVLACVQGGPCNHGLDLCAFLGFRRFSARGVGSSKTRETQFSVFQKNHRGNIFSGQVTRKNISPVFFLNLFSFDFGLFWLRWLSASR